MCTFEASTVSIILRHLRTVHASDANFSVTCGLGGCRTTSKSFSALYSHIYRHHPDIIKKRAERQELCEDVPIAIDHGSSTFFFDAQGHLVNMMYAVAS